MSNPVQYAVLKLDDVINVLTHAIQNVDQLQVMTDLRVQEDKFFQSKILITHFYEFLS
jgi:hypothetical protein